MKETLAELEVAILANNPDRMATYQGLRYSKLEPSLSPPLSAKIALVIPSKFDGCSPENLLPQQPQLGISSKPQRVELKGETQYYDSPHVQLQEQPKESIIMKATKEQDVHKVDHGTVKTKEDINNTAMDQFKKKFKLKRLPIIDFIIPNVFNDMVARRNLLSLMIPKVIDKLVQVSSLNVLILPHYKTRGRVSSNWGRMMQSWKLKLLLLLWGPRVKSN